MTIWEIPNGLLWSYPGTNWHESYLSSSLPLSQHNQCGTPVVLSTLFLLEEIRSVCIGMGDARCWVWCVACSKVNHDEHTGRMEERERKDYQVWGKRRGTRGRETPVRYMEMRRERRGSG